MKTNNERGEILIIGIDDLSDVLNKIGGAEIYVDNRFYKVLDATPKGLVGESGLLSGWRDLDDRHTERDGIFFGINDKDYFYFKLTDKEREDNPYSFWAEKRADMEDAFRDAGEDGDMIPYLSETLKIRKIIREALSESALPDEDDDEEIRVCADCGEEIESDTFVGDEGRSICPECGPVENTTHITRGEQKRREEAEYERYLKQREERMKRKGLDENKLIIRNLIRKSLKNNSL